jgi:hypothetical protein
MITFVKKEKPQEKKNNKFFLSYGLFPSRKQDQNNTE